MTLAKLSSEVTTGASIIKENVKLFNRTDYDNKSTFNSFIIYSIIILIKYTLYK